MTKLEGMFDRSAPMARTVDVFVGAAILLGIVLLFYIDVTFPRGVVDGVGYAAVVALCARFGRRFVMACAVFTTVLIIVASFLLPDAGIAVAGELANRFFALVTVWIVAMVLSRQLSLEAEAQVRQGSLELHQAATTEAFREALLSTGSFRQRLRRISEIGAHTLKVDRVGVFNLLPGTNIMRCLDMYLRNTGEHTVVPDLDDNSTPAFLEAMDRELAFVANDVRESKALGIRAKLFEERGIRAVLSAAVVIEGQRVGQVTFGHLNTPRRWTAQEIAFVRALGAFVSLLFTSQQVRRAFSALDMVGEGIYTTSTDGNVLYANRTATKIAETVTGLISEKDRPLPARAYPASQIPLEGAADVQVVHLDGLELEVLRTRVPNGGFIARINDVTEHNAALRERLQLQARLEQSAKMEAIGQLAGGVAHDFNNIMGSIGGFAGFLAQDLAEGSAEKQFADRILAACQRGKELVEQILDFARARTVERGMVDLERFAKECAELAATYLPPSVKLQTEIDVPVSFVSGSSVQLLQMFTNLGRNAQFAMTEGQGVMTLKFQRADKAALKGLLTRTLGPHDLIIGEYDGDRDYACITVSDTGSGISPEALQRIFEPFFTTKSRAQGTGLGLAVVHGVVMSHGGLCHVHSEPGNGTTFSIYLPLVQAPVTSAVATEVDSDIRGRERVLVVDDQADIVDILTIGLARLGYDAVGVDDPLAALQAIEEDASAWDVIVSDQAMPGLKGLELIKKAKALRPDLKAVLCTGFSDGMGETLSLQAGADAFFHKPVDATAIARSIRKLNAAAKKIQP